MRRPRPLPTRPVVKTPKEASVAAIDVLAVTLVPASSPRMMGPAPSAHAQLNSDSFCGGGGGGGAGWAALAA